MISHERLLELLDYDPLTGIFRWKISKGWVKSGSIAGSVSIISRYLQICLDGKLYYGHRLAWFYQKGAWPKGRLDHRNLKRSDNIFDNLREATNSQNMQNGGIRKDNSSGVRGVYWNKKVGKWQAQIGINGTVKYLGIFDQLSDAKKVRSLAARDHFGEFYNEA